MRYILVVNGKQITDCDAYNLIIERGIGICLYLGLTFRNPSRPERERGIMDFWYNLKGDEMYLQKVTEIGKNHYIGIK